MTLNQKEMTLLNDLISQEQVCIEKYNKYSNDAYDGQLKNLFSQLEQTERQHLNTLNQISSGTVPQLNAGGSGGNSQSAAQTAAMPTYTAQLNDPNMQKDKFLCDDALSTEKHVSSTYNTCIFEFRDTNIRNVLNHIQKEEQGHGEKIYNYMSQNGMYNA